MIWRGIMLHCAPELSYKKMSIILFSYKKFIIIIESLTNKVYTFILAFKFNMQK